MTPMRRTRSDCADAIDAQDAAGTNNAVEKRVMNSRRLIAPPGSDKAS
jgi:hypothetical protein